MGSPCGERQPLAGKPAGSKEESDARASPMIAAERPSRYPFPWSRALGGKGGVRAKKAPDAAPRVPSGEGLQFPNVFVPEGK